MKFRAAASLAALSVAVLTFAGWQASIPPAAPQTTAKAAAAPVLAEDVYNNIQLLKGAPAESVIPTMEQIRHTIGVDCAYCHTPHEWANDDKKPKQTARQMFQMLGLVKSTYFAGNPKVSCWTCHRAHNVPESLPPDDAAAQRVAAMIDIPAADQSKPAEQVFKNIQYFKGIPARMVPIAMAGISRSLGVRCNYCHNPDDFSSDAKVPKQTAREMLKMAAGMRERFFKGDTMMGCYTCHHGQQTPEIEEGKPVE